MNDSDTASWLGGVLQISGRRSLLGLIAAVVMTSAGCGGEDSPAGTAAAPAGPVAAASAGAASAPGVAVPVAEVLPSLDAKPTALDASRLMHQATMGATAEDIASMADTSIDHWLDDQFNQPFVSLAAAMVAADPTGPGANKQFAPFNSAMWEQTIRGSDQLRQRARYALSQILVVSAVDGKLYDRPILMAAHFDTLGRHAFGNFRDLLQEATLNPGMGWYISYLANDRDYPNNPRRPDENFAREVMQLFTIGLVQLKADGTPKLDAKGATIPTYDQSVVMGMAKVFTGWAWRLAEDGSGGYSWFPQDTSQRSMAKPMMAYADHHSPSEKQLLDGVVIPAGGTAESDMRIALDQLFNHPNTGPFIGKKLIQRMVTSNPTPAYVARVSAVFANNGTGVRGDLKAVFRAILTDPEARSPTVAKTARFGRLREPILRFANLARGAKLQVPGGGLGWVPDLSDQGTAFGQNLLKSSTVFGFSRPGFGTKNFVAQGLVSPEFQNVNEENVATISNSMFQIIHSADQVPRFCCNEFPKPDLSRWAAMADQPGAMVDDLNTVFAAGAMNAGTRQLIGTALLEIATSRTDWRRERAQLALHLTLSSASYLVQK